MNPHSSSETGPTRTLRFDILSGLTSVEEAVKQIAATRHKMSIAELGTLAGVGVLDQFRTAQADTTIHWWKEPALAISGVYALVAAAVPALGLAAGIALDIAIFGGAATKLLQVNASYKALGFGSLVFAVGLGIALAFRKYLTPLLVIACIGASLIAADNVGFRDQFANLLPVLKQPETEAAATVASLTGAQTALQKQKDSDDTKLATGGVGGKPILADGFPGNDEEGNAYLADSKDCARQLATIGANLAAATTQRDLAKKDNWAQYLGRLMAAVYMFAWLAASQFVVATVIELGPGILQRQRQQSSIHQPKALFVRDLTASDPNQIRCLATAAVSDFLMRFNRILASSAAAKERSIQDNFQSLFEEASLLEMRRIGVDLVCGTLMTTRTAGTETGAARAAASAG